MSHLIINTVVTFIISTILGYCISIIKNYKKKLEEKTKNENIQNEALRSLLKSQLTNIFFNYNQKKKIPDYIYENFLEMLKVYEGLNGNGFVHNIASQMLSWEIIKTDIL